MIFHFFLRGSRGLVSRLSFLLVQIVTKVNLFEETLQRSTHEWVFVS